MINHNKIGDLYMTPKEITLSFAAIAVAVAIIVYLYFTFAMSKTATPAGSGGAGTVPVPGPWKCLPGIDTWVRLDKDGDTSCNSVDGKNCIWDSCASPPIAAPQQKSLSCGEMHQQVYGSTGYDNPGWCLDGRDALTR